MKWIIFWAVLILHGSVIRAQLPSFLSALYGGVTSTPKPLIRPRPRIDRQQDDAYSGPAIPIGNNNKPISNNVNNQIITAPPPPSVPNNPLTNNYVVNNIGPSLSNSIGPSLSNNGIGPSLSISNGPNLGSSAPINVPSSFPGSTPVS